MLSTTPLSMKQNSVKQDTMLVRDPAGGGREMAGLGGHVALTGLRAGRCAEMVAIGSRDPPAMLWCCSTAEESEKHDLIRGVRCRKWC